MLLPAQRHGDMMGIINQGLYGKVEARIANDLGPRDPRK
jgi:hypothetical protein